MKPTNEEERKRTLDFLQAMERRAIDRLNEALPSRDDDVPVTRIPVWQELDRDRMIKYHDFLVPETPDNDSLNESGETNPVDESQDGDDT